MTTKKSLFPVILIIFQIHNITSVLAGTENNKEIPAHKGTVFVPAAGKSIEKKSVAIRYDLSTREVFARQFLEINYRVKSNDSYITMSAIAGSHSGQEFISLPVRKSRLADTDKWKYQYKMTVLYYSSRADKMELNIPALSYSEGGKEKFRFQFAKQVISVKALPPYLPPYIPMGEIRIISDLPVKSAWYRPYDVGSIYYWNITLTGKNMTSDVVPEIRQQIRSTKRIRFLPAEVTRKTLKTENQLLQHVHYSIPFVLNKSGSFSLPELRVQYFDTSEQRMHTSTFVTGMVFSLHRYLKWLILAGLAALVLWVVWRLAPWVKESARRLHYLHNARLQLKRAITPVEIREAMSLMATSFGWPKNMPLSQWYGYWEKNFKRDENLSVLVNSLGRSLYTPSKHKKTAGNLSGYLLDAGYLGQFRRCLMAASRQPW